ncbi:MAG: protein-L-isoaspartate O-methyltransferase [Patescibacteria group bacterium]|nr:protein-L-isoaspartate O-methyltransferase [Patescibacteria group bacterium]
MSPGSLDSLYEHLRSSQVLKTKSIKRAFLENDRADFVPLELLALAYADRPLPIFQGQTISQPATVVIMLELLKVKTGQTVLDIGSGSGWTSALLAHIVGPKGQVIATEINPRLAAFANKNLKKFPYKNISLYNKDYQDILANIPYPDRILSSAAFSRAPDVKELTKKLKAPGRFVFPTDEHDLRLIKKMPSGKTRKKIIPGFAFVPIVH